MIEAQRFRYANSALYRDYAQAAIGIVIFGVPLVFFAPNIYVAVILGGIVAIFIAFGWSTWQRHQSVIVLTDAAISLEGRQAVRIFWPDVERVRLRYYPVGSARRRGEQEHGKGGVMQLRLDSAGKSIRIDSALEGFEAVAAQVAAAIHRHDIATAPATKPNFAALGLAPNPSWAEEV